MVSRLRPEKAFTEEPEPGARLMRQRNMRQVSIGLLLAALAACAAGAQRADTVVDGVAVATGAVPLCEELDWFTGPEELYGESPIYVGNEMPIEAVSAYARGMEGFVDAWIDREHNGWVNAGFTGVDVDAAQEELSEAFPDEGVVAVALPYSHEELESIRQRVARSIPEDFEALNTHFLHGRVEVDVGVLTEERISRVHETVSDEPVCAVGLDPTTTIPAGEQPGSGDGWTFLGVVDDSLGPIAVLGDQAAYEQMWDQLLGGEAPLVDFSASIVVALEIGYSGSCSETRLDGVEFTDSAIRLVINTVTESRDCTSDYNPRTYIAVIDRDRLPAPPFTVGWADWVADAAQIRDDLREPNSTPSRLEQAPEPAPAVDLPDFMETGFRGEAVIDTSCGIEYLGEVNSIHWRTNESFPDEWEAFVVEESLLPVTLLLEEGPQPTLTVTAGNHTVTYRPGEPLPCQLP